MYDLWLLIDSVFVENCKFLWPTLDFSWNKMKSIHSNAQYTVVICPELRSFILLLFIYSTIFYLMFGSLGMHLCD